MNQPYSIERKSVRVERNMPSGVLVNRGPCKATLQEYFAIPPVGHVAAQSIRLEQLELLRKTRTLV